MRRVIRRKKGRSLPILYSEECKYRLRLERARREVWGGKSPRVLTKAALASRL